MANTAAIGRAKNRDGDIATVCIPVTGSPPRLKQDAIRDIESGARNYDVPT